MKNRRIWILVEIKSGIPLSVKPFSDKKAAEEEEEKVRLNLNLENDETGIFPIDVPNEEI